ncbi:MAG: MBOAT family protein [Bacteroidetes bacterium]|nr:MAG: MBOAT family protein [Bacteroidota bacterium]
MVFSSVIFLLYFLPVFYLSYQFVGTRYKNYLILLASIFFYAWGAPDFIFIVLGSSVIDYQIVNLLHKSQDERKRKILLFLFVFLNLGLLAYFKYANFFVDNLNSLLANIGFQHVSWTSIALPIGISFYTFQSITYAVDVYRKESEPVVKLTDYLVYILSFPQMIAGPIVKYGDIAKQLISRSETNDDRLIGFYRFAIGLSKKVLIANVMAEQADIIFNSDYSTLNWGNAWIGALAYTMQIYFDFSGYSDMAIGLGRMMGFRFPENFDSPYVSRSISEFWRRWHITLGTFMKEYLYIPLGGNRARIFRVYFNLILVFLLSGLWHGASWNFILWGGYHGLFLILDRIFLLKLLNKLGVVFSVASTFFIVVVGWVIFRIEDFNKIGDFFRSMMGKGNASVFKDDLVLLDFNIIFIIAVIFSFVTLMNWGKKLELFFFKKEGYSTKEFIFLGVMSFVLLLLSISSLAGSAFNPFIYFRF